MAASVTEPDVSRFRTPGDGDSVDQLTKRCRVALAHLYRFAVEQERCDSVLAYDRSLRCVVGLVALLAASEQIGPDRPAAEPLKLAREALEQFIAGDGDARSLDARFSSVRESAGLDIFCRAEFEPVVLRAAARSLLSSQSDAPIDGLFFQTMPLSWIGQAYQGMLALRPVGTAGDLKASREQRKGAGVYFTPPHLVAYVVESALTPLVQALPGPIEEPCSADVVSRLRVLDPAVGGGDFLAEVVRFLGCSSPSLTTAVASQCVFGMDIDRVAVEIARFRVWAAGGYADGTSEAINSHLTCADALASEGLGPFDAVLGNPPYIASKNGLRTPGGRGQLDSYLLFLTAITQKRLVRDGGMLSMVLPDPMLVRANAAEIRRVFLTEWTLHSLLHILGSFPEANVSNVVPVLQNSPNTGNTFQAARIERSAEHRSFALRPKKTVDALGRPVSIRTALAQERCELLYLLEDGVFGDVLRRIHGPELMLTHYDSPFAPLRSLNVKAIYRGEEIGKAAIPEGEEGVPMLLGGQSIQPFEITWEGRRIPETQIRKPRYRYARTKILIQKSSAKIVAALDRVDRKHSGYVFPQSVYAVELQEPGMDEYYLLCLLNSQVLREYIWRTVTAYKMVQPQLEIEDVKALPIRIVSFTTPAGERRHLVSKAMAIYDREESVSQASPRFAELDNFAANCLGSNPEKSDVVHDILSNLGRMIVELTESGRKSPDQRTMRRLEAALSAAGAIVRRLYSSQPLQMSLPW